MRSAPLGIVLYRAARRSAANGQYAFLRGGRRSGAGKDQCDRVPPARAELPRLRDELEALGGFALSSSMRYGGLEAVPRACSKGSAIRWLCGELGIGMEQCAAFGDSSNDWDMLAAVGCGVAMENAPDDLKASARYVAPPYNQDGLAKFIMQHGF